MEYTVEIAIHAARPLTKDAIADVGELGGSAQGRPGGRRLETTLTVEAESIVGAAGRAIFRILSLVPGEPIAVEAMTTAEHDRRLTAPPLELVGVAEIAEAIGVSKQRVSTLSQRDDFPRPVAQLASGPVWRKGDLSTFAAGWRRKPGRPRKVVGE